jgi:hypothetical protein
VRFPARQARQRLQEQSIIGTREFLRSTNTSRKLLPKYIFCRQLEAEKFSHTYKLSVFEIMVNILNILFSGRKRQYAARANHRPGEREVEPMA